MLDENKSEITIKLTEEQREQIAEATGSEVEELKIEVVNDPDGGSSSRVISGDQVRAW